MSGRAGKANTLRNAGLPRRITASTARSGRTTWILPPPNASLGTPSAHQDSRKSASRPQHGTVHACRAAKELGAKARIPHQWETVARMTETHGARAIRSAHATTQHRVLSGNTRPRRRLQRLTACAPNTERCVQPTKQRLPHEQQHPTGSAPKARPLLRNLAHLAS